MANPDYFTLAELRALPQMSDTTTYTEARCLSTAAWVTSMIEVEVGASFVARTVTETHDGGVCEIVLFEPHVLSVTSATENGVAVTDVLREEDGVLRRFSGATSYYPVRWSGGTRNVSVTYQAGYSATPPGDIKDVSLQATRERLLQTNSNASTSSRQKTINTEMGSSDLAAAGADAPSGFPDMDAAIARWKRKLDNFGFA